MCVHTRFRGEGGIGSQELELQVTKLHVMGAGNQIQDFCQEQQVLLTTELTPLQHSPRHTRGEDYLHVLG